MAGGFDAHGHVLLCYLFRWVWIGEKREDKDDKREDATKRHNHSPHHRPQARTKQPVRGIFGSLECIDDAAVLVVVTRRVVTLLLSYTLHLRLPDGRPVLFCVLVLVGACQCGTVWGGLRITHDYAPAFLLGVLRSGTLLVDLMGTIDDHGDGEERHRPIGICRYTHVPRSLRPVAELPLQTCVSEWGLISTAGSCESASENSQPGQEQLASNGARQGPISCPPLPSSCERGGEEQKPSAAALQRMVGRFISALTGPSYWHGAGV